MDQAWAGYVCVGEVQRHQRRHCSEMRQTPVGHPCLVEAERLQPTQSRKVNEASACHPSVGKPQVLQVGEPRQRCQAVVGHARALHIEGVQTGQTTEVSGDGQKVTGLAYTDRNTGESQRIDLEGIFVQIGLLPNTDWLKGTLNLSRFGEIEVDARGETSLPGVFAAGDATTVPYKQIVIALGEGAKAGLSAFDHLIRSPAPEKRTSVVDQIA